MVESVEKKTPGENPGGNVGEIPERKPAAIFQVIPAGSPQHKLLEESNPTSIPIDRNIQTPKDMK